MRRVLLAAVALAAGCATIRAEHVATGPARPPFGGTVRVVMEGAPVPGDPEELGIVTATGSYRAATLPRVVGALQAEAAAIGANAVIRVRYDVGTSEATATGVAVWLK